MLLKHDSISNWHRRAASPSSSFNESYNKDDATTTSQHTRHVHATVFSLGATLLTLHTTATVSLVNCYTCRKERRHPPQTMLVPPRRGRTVMLQPETEAKRVLFLVIQLLLLSALWLVVGALSTCPVVQASRCPLDAPPSTAPFAC